MGNIFEVLCPTRFGGQTSDALTRVRVWDRNLPAKLLGAAPKRTWVQWVRYAPLTATSPTYERVTVVSIDEPAEDHDDLCCLATAITAPHLLRAWKRRSWIAYSCRRLKSLLAAVACQV